MKDFKNWLSEFKNVNANENDENFILEHIGKIKIKDNNIQSELIPVIIEEIYRAKLIIADSQWSDAFREAEDYYNDIYIAFLIHCSITDDANSADIWNKQWQDKNFNCHLFSLEKFRTFLVLSKEIFTEKTSLREDVNEHLFIGALLCMDDKTEHHTSYLTKAAENQQSCWNFLSGKSAEIGKGFGTLFVPDKKNEGQMLPQWYIMRELLVCIEREDSSKAINDRLKEIIKNLRNDEKRFNEKKDR